MYVQVQFSAHINSSKHCSELYRRLPPLRRWLFNPFDFIIKCPVCFFFSHLAHYWIPPPTGNTQVANIIFLPEALEGVRPLKSWAAWIRRSRYTMHSALPRALWSPLGSVVAPGGQPAGVCSTRVVLLRLHAMHVRLFIQATLGMADATCLRMKIKTNVVHDLMSAMRPKISASRGRWFIACASLQEKKKKFFFGSICDFEKTNVEWCDFWAPKSPPCSLPVWQCLAVLLLPQLLVVYILLHWGPSSFCTTACCSFLRWKRKHCICLKINEPLGSSLGEGTRNQSSNFACWAFFIVIIIWICIKGLWSFEHAVPHTHCCDYPNYPTFHFHGSLKKKKSLVPKKRLAAQQKKRRI